MNKYFVLYSCCIPVKGAARSTICDLQRSSFIFIPNEFYNLLKKNKLKIRYEEINKKEFKFKKLTEDIVAAEYGFYCDNPDEFPQIENSFEVPNIITNIVIDIGKSKTFDFGKLVLKLNDVTCFLAYIRLFDESDIINKMSFISEYFNNSTIRNIQFEIINNKKSNISQEGLLSINAKHPRVKKIIVRNNTINAINKFNNFECIFLKASIDSTSDCGCGLISPYNFSPNYSMFFESLKFNNCLNKKIAIDINGYIKNCPYHSKNYTHIDEIDSLKDFIANNTQFRSLWNITKDQIEVCKDCEFRYICQDCRVFTKESENLYSKPKHCKYNPYEAIWAK